MHDERTSCVACPVATGGEYMECPRDERVRDVTMHPAFRNTVRMFAERRKA